MSRFLFNVFLAVIWCLLTASATPWNFIAGGAIGALVIVAYSRIAGKGPYLRRLVALLNFGLYFAGLLVKSNLQIAKEIVTPGFSQKPRLLRYPVGHLTQTQVTTLANAITLTPGTLAVDVSPDGQWLYLHSMYAEDPESARREIDDLQAHLMKGGVRVMTTLFAKTAPLLAAEGATPWTTDLLDTVIAIGIVLMSIGVLLCMIRLLKGPTLVDRGLGADTIAIQVAGLVLLLTIRFETLVVFDVVLVVGILGFVSTLAFAQYLGRRGSAA